MPMIAMTVSSSMRVKPRGVGKAWGFVAGAGWGAGGDESNETNEAVG